MNAQEQIDFLIENPHLLLKRKPFTRGSDNIVGRRFSEHSVEVGELVDAILPSSKRITVSQETFQQELDPHSHKVLFDDNIPSITAKTNDGSYIEIEFKKMSIPFQKMIRNKHTLHLCGYGIQHTLNNLDPSDQDRDDFSVFKQYWKDRNQDGMRTKMVCTQESYGDAGLLYYMDRNGCIKSRLISYEDGYVICSHNDENGDRLIESVYYRVGSIEYIDSWDDSKHYRHAKDNNTNDKEPSWVLELEELHGFDEIPLVTKRGEVGWNDVQELIEVYEIIYNIFIVIQKRHGWGLLYIKGQFADTAKKLAGAVVLNDQSLNHDGDAKYLTPPSPEGMLDTLKSLEESIQRGSGTTFILPKDITTGGDISGIAVQITQSLDNERALQGVIEWQNVASKMTRLFKYGLAKELVSKGIDASAVTRFSNLNVSGAFKVWRPRNDVEYNQMLGTLKSQGLISEKTGIEKNTESTPDELVRIETQKLELKAEAEDEARLQAQYDTSDDNSN